MNPLELTGAWLCHLELAVSGQRAAGDQARSQVMQSRQPLSLGFHKREARNQADEDAHNV